MKKRSQQQAKQIDDNTVHRRWHIGISIPMSFQNKSCYSIIKYCDNTYATYTTYTYAILKALPFVHNLSRRSSLEELGKV